MTKNKRKKNNTSTVAEQTGFTKSEWYGTGKRERSKQKRKKGKKSIKHTTTTSRSNIK